jgi:imidazolonepropionase-like amidohydrolase
VNALVLRGVRVWDGDAPGHLPDVDALRIEGGRIAALGRSGDLSAGALAVELHGASLVPGLIDAHVHLDLDPSLVTPQEQARVAPVRAEQALRERAAAMLRAGITTARDLGGPAWRELALRDRIARGDAQGPRLLCAGQPLTTPRGHCWFWGGEAADADGLERGVARQVERGADWIKLIATGGRITAGTQPHEPQFSSEELSRAVRAAAERGRPVAAHCHGTAGIRNSALAGVRSAEHCSFAGPAGFGSDFDARVAGLLAERGVWVSATVNSGWARHHDASGQPSAFAQRMAGVYLGLRRAGVRIVASTDAGIPGVTHDDLPRALAVFARIAGLDFRAALRAASSDAADALGLSDRIGRLRPGLVADLLAVEGDPLRDLGALSRPLRVFAAGREVAGASPSPVAPIQAP